MRQSFDATTAHSKTPATQIFLDVRRNSNSKDKKLAAPKRTAQSIMTNTSIQMVGTPVNGKATPKSCSVTLLKNANAEMLAESGTIMTAYQMKKFISERQLAVEDIIGNLFRQNKRGKFTLDTFEKSIIALFPTIKQEMCRAFARKLFELADSVMLSNPPRYNSGRMANSTWT
jgi:hypothetical protein